MFSFADDICIVAQDEKFENMLRTLISELLRMENYFQKWRLRPNLHKTMISTFHLNNREANKEISVHFCGERIKNEKTPVYFGITLDRTLSFKIHLHKLSAKLKTRIGLINKLVGTTGSCNKCSTDFLLSPGLLGCRVLHPCVGRKRPHRGGRHPFRKGDAHNNRQL